MLYVIVQTKATKSKSILRGRTRGEVWSTEAPASNSNSILAQLIKSDGGDGEVVGSYRSYIDLSKAMERYRVLILDTDLPNGKKGTDAAIALARKHFTLIE